MVMTWNTDGTELGRAAHEICKESQRLRQAAREAVTRSQTARAAEGREDLVGRRERLLAAKAREIAQIEKAIRFYVSMATYWHQHSNDAVAEKMEARTVAERERLRLAIAEREAWPPAF
jgi:hypothetical protein